MIFLFSFRKILYNSFIPIFIHMIFFFFTKHKTCTGLWRKNLYREKTIINIRNNMYILEEIRIHFLGVDPISVHLETQMVSPFFRVFIPLFCLTFFFHQDNFWSLWTSILKFIMKLFEFSLHIQHVSLHFHIQHVLWQ